VTHLNWGLQGRVVIVTGGLGAIGAAVCEGFREAGAVVAVVDRTGPYAHDLRDIAGLPGLVARIEGDLGLATVLVNVAGIIIRTADLFSVTEDDWDAQHDVNLKATFFLTQAFGKRLVDAAMPGSVVNYSSQGWMSGGFGGSVVYNATKGAVTTMTRGMARSWAPHGIRVNAVAPGLVETPMLVGQPGDHVGATVFLASDMAAYMTGAVVNVSGGFLMY
jgi:NAD(P)-dependent dehydrogenase (short-subunit alcohol dehydrogenase family)